MAAIEERGSSLKLSGTTIAGITLASAIYFADLFLKASRKCFWFDELFTVYLCRLPTFEATWAAVKHGTDFNPPLFYLLIRCVQRIFGEGLVATRLPAIMGVWLFCICLFIFVARRAGAVSGFLAGAFPFFTLAQYYAFEARAHGITLGWCGLAIVCWQRCEEGQTKYLWLGGFGLSIVGALLTHVYAVYLLIPFAMVELYSLIKTGRPNWGIVAVLSLSFACVTWFIYLPLVRQYRAAMPTTFFPTSHDMFERFLISAIGPATPILVIWLLLGAIDSALDRPPSNALRPIPLREILLAAGLALIPLFGLLGCRISHSPFIYRYFLSSIAGYALFFGFFSYRWRDSWIPRVMAGCMLLSATADLGSTLYLSSKQRYVLFEPSSGARLSTTPDKPMSFYDTVSNDENGLDILVVQSLDYLYFFRYAPRPLVPHLYFAAPADDPFLAAYRKLGVAAHLEIKTTTFDPFLSTHQRFLIYVHGSGSIPAEKVIANYGFRLESVRTDMVGVMYEYAK